MRLLAFAKNPDSRPVPSRRDSPALGDIASRGPESGSSPFLHGPVLHLTASPFFGGPERVILDIVKTMRKESYGVESIVATFRENGGCDPFLDELRKNKIEGIRLRHDMPRLLAAIREITTLLHERRVELLCAHGHKSRLLGWIAARRLGIPIVGVSHGWTWQDWKTSLYERLDRWMHRRMDAVVAVSQGQADKIILSGTPIDRVYVIHNAIDFERFNDPPREEYRRIVDSFFERRPFFLVGAAGRLSPEKGFDVLIDAVAQCRQHVGVLLFGEGVLREELQKRIDRAHLSDRFKLAGFTKELDRLLPHVDLFVQSSRTEGFPCVNLEAMAARRAVVATAVGGVPEQVIPEQTGLLVPPNDPEALSAALDRLAVDEPLRHHMGETGRRFVAEKFTCDVQAGKYWKLFRQLTEQATKVT